MSHLAVELGLYMEVIVRLQLHLILTSRNTDYSDVDR